MSTPFTHSFWMDQALAREADSQPQDQTEKSPLTGHQQTDICIVGAGFTGLWCATGQPRTAYCGAGKKPQWQWCIRA
ncbi:MAG: hypothetical protein ACRCYD_12960 [Plesiomonas sp.]